MTTPSPAAPVPAAAPVREPAPAAAPAPLPRTRADRLRRLPWGTLLLEGLLTVVAILLALAADDWRQRREDRRFAAEALESFRRELVTNRDHLAAVRPYHDSLRVALDAAMRRAGGAAIRSPGDVFPNFRGVRPAFLVSAAWESAVATGALRHMDQPTVQELAALYTRQRDLELLNRQMYAAVLTPAVLAAADFTPAARLMSVYLADLDAKEQELVESYARLLGRVGAPAAPAAATAP